MSEPKKIYVKDLLEELQGMDPETPVYLVNVMHQEGVPAHVYGPALLDHMVVSTPGGLLISPAFEPGDEELLQRDWEKRITQVTEGQSDSAEAPPNPIALAMFLKMLLEQKQKAEQQKAPEEEAPLLN